MKNSYLSLSFLFISLPTIGANITPSECKEFEKKVGQMFYITADGFASDYTIHPAYESLIKKMQPGGVLPHYNSKDIEKIREASLRLQENSDLPLMIGIDYQSMSGVTVGLGFGAGLADNIKSSDVSCFERIGQIEAALHQYAGINNPLGPTVEYNTSAQSTFPSRDTSYRSPRLKAIMDSFRSAGLETTIKHFPYTPSDYNLHKTSKDTKVPASEVDEKYMPIYKELGKNSGFLMTTHLMNSSIDPANMATFSKVWMNKLRHEVGFKGIAMTDALFMINSYPDTMKKMSRDWPARLAKDFNKDLSIFAIKAILAGHDMVFLETAAKETEATWKDVSRFACQDDPLASDFRKRVNESYDRIVSYKNTNRSLKNTNTSLTKDDVKLLLAAKKNQDLVCGKSDPKLEAIFSKVRRHPTKIDDTVFHCEDSSLIVNSVFNDELKKLNKDNIEIVKNIIVKGLNSQNPDDITATLGYLEINPALKEHLKGLLTQDLLSDDKKKTFEAYKTLSDLDLTEDEDYFINVIVINSDVESFASYVDLAARNKVSKPDTKISKEARIKLYRDYSKTHSLDLSRPMKGDSAFRAINILFPPYVINSFTSEDLATSGFGIDEQILMKAQKVRSGAMKLSKTEYLRLLDVTFKNPKLSEYYIENSLGRVDNLIEEPSILEDKKLLSGEERRKIRHEIQNVKNTMEPQGRTYDSKWEGLSKLEIIIADDPKVSNEILHKQLQEFDKMISMIGGSEEFNEVMMKGYAIDETLKLVNGLGQKINSDYEKKLSEIILKNWDKLPLHVSSIQSLMNRNSDAYKEKLKNR